MTSRNELEAKTVSELREIADGLGLNIHHKTGHASMVTQIMQAVTPNGEEAKPEVEPVVEAAPAVDPAPVSSEPKPPPAAPVVKKSDKQTKIMEAVELHRARGMVVSFPDADSWFFRKGEREDSGSVGIPLTTIRRCADRVCQPPKAPSAKKS